MSSIKVQSDLPINLIVSTIMMTYNSTPHIMTGESHFTLITGMDMVIPQSQQLYSFVDHYQREGHMEFVNTLRNESLHYMIDKLKIDVKSKSNKFTKVQVGDLVICQYNPKELLNLSKINKGVKLLPKYSEPYRVIKLCNSSGTQLKVQSIWSHKKSKIINLSQTIKLPKLSDYNLMDAKLDILNDTDNNTQNNAEWMANKRMKK